MKQRRSSWVLGIVALLLTVPATLAIARADDGLARGHDVVDGVPVTTLVADTGVRSPVVVVAHGFAGSAQLMDGIGIGLARAGYATVLLDFTGHGTNGARLPLDGSSPTTDVLDADLGAVVAWARQQPWADPARVGLVGHSMGAGTVVRYAVADAQGPKLVTATVALSLPDADPVPAGEAAVPRDLLLLVGANEQSRFTDAAVQALTAAYPGGQLGQAFGSSVDGSARAAYAVPRADHITILFSTQALQQTVDWLDSSVGAPSAGHTVGGGTLGWLLVLTVGAAIGFVPLARLAYAGRPEPERVSPAAAASGSAAADVPAGPRRTRALVVVAVAVVASVLASLAARALAPVADVVPLAVGGYVVVWFAVAGAASFLLAALLRRRTPRVPPTVNLNDPPARFPWRDLWATLALTSYAVVALGLVAQQTWTAFAFAGDRARWLLVVELAFIVWFWADDRLVGERWWLGIVTRVVAVGVLLASVVVLGAPGFLTLLVPLVAVVLLLLLVYGQTVTRRAQLPWAAALVQAIPLAYLVTTTFPLVS
ncbi:MAG: alpha/beta fold hydrolase [Candidatus Nanopelagicales bacterium]